jgi:hypothetical protein
MSKIVYLFEASSLIENLDGKYFVNYNDDIYIFSEAPSSEFYEDGDILLYHYFIRLGKIQYVDAPLHFNIV